MNLYKIFFVGVLSPNVVVFGHIEFCCPKNDPLLNMSLVIFITPSLYSENNTACDATPFLSLLFKALTLTSSTIWSLNEVESYLREVFDMNCRDDFKKFCADYKIVEEYRYM